MDLQIPVSCETATKTACDNTQYLMSVESHRPARSGKPKENTNGTISKGSLWTGVQTEGYNSHHTRRRAQKNNKTVSQAVSEGGCRGCRV